MNTKSLPTESFLCDRPFLSTKQRYVIGLLVPLLLGVLCAVGYLTGALDALERLSLDWRFRHRGPLKPDPRVLIVQVSEADRDKLTEQELRFDLRAFLDEAIERLADAGAVAVGLDFWLQGRGDHDIDTRLAEVIAENNVVLGVAVANDRYVRSPGILLESEPDEGSLVVEPDPDGVLRRLPQLPNLDVLNDQAGGTVRIPHLSFVLSYLLLADEAQLAGKGLPDLDLPATGQARIGDRVVRYGQLVNYAAGPGQGFTTYNFADVVRGQCDLTPVDGAVVIIGATRSIEDQFLTPLTAKLIPGVYYHANVIDMILQDRPLIEWPADRLTVALLVGLMGCVSGLYFLNLRQWWAHRAGGLYLAIYFLIGVVVFVGGWCWLCHFVFARQIVLPMVSPIVAVGAVMLLALALQLVVTIANTRRLSQRNRQIEALFGRSVSSQVLAAIKADPASVARTEVREVSVLFCDVRGFTTTATHMSPEIVAAMLNEYFDAITSAVFNYDGFVDKFVGDELMAVFGAPLDQPDHAMRAAEAAVAIKRQLAVLNKKRLARGQESLNCGIGIHCGPAAAGHIGTAQRANYTVVGDTVNLAARIEEYTTGGEILISESVARRLQDHLTIPTPAPPQRHDTPYSNMEEGRADSMIEHAIQSEQLHVQQWKTVKLRGIDGQCQLYQLHVD